MLKEAFEYAREYLNLVLELEEDKEDVKSTLRVVHAYGNFATTYQKMAKYDEAEEYFEKMISILEDCKLKSQGDENRNKEIDEKLASIYMSIVDISAKTEKYKRAIEYLLKFIELWGEIGEGDKDAINREIAIRWYDIGVYYYKSNDFIESEAAFRKSLEIRAFIGNNLPEDTLEESATFECISVVCNKQKKVEVALEMQIKSVDIFREIYNKDPEKHRGRFVFLLKLLINLYKELDMEEEATRVEEEVDELSEVTHLT